MSANYLSSSSRPNKPRTTNLGEGAYGEKRRTKENELEVEQK